MLRWAKEQMIFFSVEAVRKYSPNVEGFFIMVKGGK